jgi:2-polyprenyl-3-methyl-5-hydroxy-6-metoxy-1,4-benzoquinol methylase
MESHANEEELEDVRLFDPPLWMQRRTFVNKILGDFGVAEVFDVGCGEGALLEVLKNSTQFNRLLGLDIAELEIEQAKRTCAPSEYQILFPRERELKVELYIGSIADYDIRFNGIECITAVEVIEHLHPDVLEKFTQNVFGRYKPRLVIISTPNAEYNIHFDGLNYGTPDAVFRHDDHKFEWTRAEFNDWYSFSVYI